MKVLLLGGSFSGITNSLANAMSSYVAVETISPSLRILKGYRLPLILGIFIEAILTYGYKFWQYKSRTWFASFAKSLACQKLAEKSNAGVILIMGINYASFTKRKKDKKYILYTDHTNLLSKKQKNYGFKAIEKGTSTFWNYIEKKIIHSQNFCFVMSEHVKHSMITDYKLSQRKAIVAGGGPNTDVDIERDVVEKSYSDFNILFVGLDAKRKGLDNVVEAFYRIQAVHPSVKLHIVGVDGKSHKSIIYYGKIYGQALKKLFYNAQIFCMPTYREPFGIVFIEAMMSKCVCIGTNIEAIPEIISHGETGFIVNPEDVEAIAAHCIDLFSNPQSLKKLATAGYQKAKLTWGWDKTARTILHKCGVLSS